MKTERTYFGKQVGEGLHVKLEKSEFDSGEMQLGRGEDHQEDHGEGGHERYLVVQRSIL